VRIFVAYPGHSISTFDVAEGWHQALKRLGHEVFHMNYEYNMPLYGAVLDYWNEKSPNVNFQATLRDVMWLASQDLICKVLECMPLDFVLFVTGLLHHPRAFELIQKMGVKTVLLFTESPYNDEMLEELLPIPDVVFTNDKNSVDAFQRVNPQSFYMPHSYDPAKHHPPEEPINGEYKHDVFFFGSLYEERKALFDALIQREGTDVGFDIYGTGMRPTGEVFVIHKDWPDVERDGGMPNRELVKHYWGSKIVLSPNRTTADYFAKTQITEEAWSLGPRVYEVAACGAFQLTDGSRAELFDVFGDTIPVYHNAEHLGQLIDLYISYPRWREEMTKRARMRVKPCTFENRATQILLPILEEVL